MSKLDNYISVVLPLNELQDNFLEKAKKERFATAVCYSFEEFVKITTQYLK